MTEMISEPRAYIRHMRACGLCGRGSRAWCAAHGIDWTDFVQNGIPAQRLIDTGDPIVAPMAKLAIEEANNGR